MEMEAPSDGLLVSSVLENCAKLLAISQILKFCQARDFYFKSMVNISYFFYLYEMNTLKCNDRKE